MTDKLTDAQAIELDNKNRAQWEKDHPGKPYHSHLTPRQQSLRDQQRQDAARQDKEDQANINNQDRQRALDNQTNAEADAQVKASKELEDDDAKAPAEKPTLLDRRHKNSVDMRPIKTERRHNAPDTRR